MREQKLTRRTFLGLGATAAVAGAAGLAGCAPAAKSDAGADAGAAEGGAAGSGGAAAGGNPTEFVPSFMNPPAPVDESKVTETVDVDVCVVGLGLAGVCALREAAESGAKTFGFDKGSDVGYRSGEFGTFGSEIHKQLGIEQPETQEVVNELMKVMGNRPNAQLLNYWIANSGPDLDWYIGTAEHELLTSDHAAPTDPEKPYVLPERFPVNENYNWREENYPCFPGMVHLLPDHGWAMHGTLEAAQKAGAEARFNLKGEQLIKEGDKVVGVYASDEDGNIVRVNAKKGVVLSCGDMSSDTEMLTYYAPQATKYGCFFSTMDKSGKPVNTGDGHKMAMWAGAVMEDGPYAPMTHSLGTNSVPHGEPGRQALRQRGRGSAGAAERHQASEGRRVVPDLRQQVERAAVGDAPVLRRRDALHPARAGSRVRARHQPLRCGLRPRHVLPGRDRAGLHHPGRFHRGVGEGREHPG